MKLNVNILKIIAFLFLLSGIGCSTNQKLKLEMVPLFSDNMVLQQQKEIPVWGIAPPYSKVSVLFRKQFVKTKADENGKWIVRLKPENVGRNETLTVKCRNKKILCKNVAVGEVWIASGQSNMEVSLVNNWGPVNNGIQEASNASYPDIRLFIVNRNSSVEPVDTISSDGWKPCSPEIVKNFSAVAYFFGRELYNQLHIPVGLIESAWGGTVAEAWTSAESLELMEDFTSYVQKIRSLPKNIDGQQKQFEKDDFQMHIEMSRKDPGIMGKDTIFKTIGVNDAGWSTMNLPGLWENSSFGVFDGSVWFRKHIELPIEMSRKKMVLNIGPSDDFDEAWVNGVKVGQSGFWGEPRHYPIREGIIKYGDNVITLRVSDFQGAGGFNGKPENFYLSGPDNFILDLSGEWLIHAGYNKREIESMAMKPGDSNRPTTLFNGMINPLIPYSFKGVIWYQGESNTGMAWQYRDLFPTLIKDWRNHWKAGDFPFYFVQLANHMQRNDQPVDDMWAELREAQTLALQQPNTGMAVTIDIGDALNIHPGNKQDVGKRLALWALNKNYQIDIPFSGPLYKSCEILGDKIFIRFDHIYNGLSASGHSKLTGFAIAGDDKMFHWADATISGNSVIVSCKDVVNPVAVRYAWSSNPECNLVNSANLPASPFRTDDWDLITK
jgi:sialate O-acetylesterase